MPRLSQVGRSEASERVRRAYEMVFGDRDPVSEPGTSTGTPGNWWTTMALSPYVFEHATFGMSADQNPVQLDEKIRELALMRTGYAQGSRFVFSQHCKAARRVGVSEAQIEAITDWQISDAFNDKERTVLSWVDALILQGGRASDALFRSLHQHFNDAEILELTYRTMTYNLHAVCCKALRLEYDDVDERISEVPVPEDGGLADWSS